MHIMNGRLYVDREGDFTCFANDGSSVVHYMIALSSLFPKFSSFGVGNFDMSDHLPLYCSLKLDYRNSTFGNVLHHI